ncbi:putative DNA-binding transcriptional regulator YafY [Friedmanniella endophytica]|uniref:Putative DNA-binding transcriptional regulator YafY n=1 Tax=Microlunatus kandeliicorticis TaxID=1759536 RepID=A0A7W3ISZ8_9ACTN|nr:WYL domain-containing protein [Microlunatus kandeliicorticis]MBA8794696.1 putative DNA-binding transcriptional regulator YafY [Microlunatus kandeliicorticis]
MLSTSARLLRLLSLLQTPRDWTGPQLAVRLGVSTRTVRADVERLRELGYPVDGRPGATGGYRLRPGAELPPLLLDDDEAVAVAVALHAGASGALGGMEEVALRALTKIVALLPARLRRRVEAVQGVSTVLPDGGPRVPPELLIAVAQACRDHEGLRFDYDRPAWTAGGATPPVERPRRVEPHELVHRAGRWYLVAWDLDRRDWRSFRLDRMLLRTPGGPRFEPRPVPGGDAGRFVTERVEAFTRRYPVVIRLHAPRDRLAAWMDPGWGELTAVDADTTEFRAATESHAAIAVWMASTGVEFTVVDPPELRDSLAGLAARMARAAERRP